MRTFFTVHILNRDDSQASLDARQTYTASVRQILASVDEVFFAGKMDYARISLIDRVLAKAVEKQTNSRVGDFRDWGVIRCWAQTIFTLNAV